MKMEQQLEKPKEIHIKIKLIWIVLVFSIILIGGISIYKYKTKDGIMGGSIDSIYKSIDEEPITINTTDSSFDKFISLEDASKILGFAVPEAETGDKSQEVFFIEKEVETNGNVITLTLYSAPYFFNINTELEESKTDIEKESYEYKVENNLFYTYFGSKIRLEYANTYLTISPQGDLSSPIIKGNTIAYPNFGKNYSLNFAVTREGVKEYIIVYNETDSISFDFKIETNMKPSADLERGIIMKAGELEVMEMGIPYGSDSKSSLFTGTMIYNPKENLVKVSFSLGKETKFPILIDPPIKVLTNITNAGTEDAYICPAAGCYNMTSVIKFNISEVANAQSEVHVLEAKLGLMAQFIESGGVTVYGINCSNQSWMETLSAASLKSSMMLSCKGTQLIKTAWNTFGWKLFDVTPAVNASFLTGEKNFTMLLNASDMVFDWASIGNVALLYVRNSVTIAGGYTGVQINSSEAAGTYCGAGNPCVPYLQINYSYCNCPTIADTGWTINKSECTIGSGETCNLGTGELKVEKVGYLNVLSGGEMRATTCSFNSSDSRYRVYSQYGGQLKCGK